MTRGVARRQDLEHRGTLFRRGIEELIEQRLELRPLRWQQWIDRLPRAVVSRHAQSARRRSVRAFIQSR